MREARGLQLHADQAVETAGLASRIDAEDVESAGVGAAETFEALERRGLARAVWAEQTEDLTPADGEADVVDRGHISVRLAEVGHLDCDLRTRPIGRAIRCLVDGLLER